MASAISGSLNNKLFYFCGFIRNILCKKNTPHSLDEPKTKCLSLYLEYYERRIYKREEESRFILLSTVVITSTFSKAVSVISVVKYQFYI